MCLAQSLIASWLCVKRGGYPTSFLWSVRSWTLWPRPSLSVIVFIADGGRGRKLILSKWLPAEACVSRRDCSEKVGRSAGSKTSSKRHISPVSVCHAPQCRYELWHRKFVTHDQFARITQNQTLRLLLSVVNGILFVLFWKNSSCSPSCGVLDWYQDKACVFLMKLWVDELILPESLSQTQDFHPGGHCSCPVSQQKSMLTYYFKPEGVRVCECPRTVSRYFTTSFGTHSAHEELLHVRVVHSCLCTRPFGSIIQALVFIKA